MWRTLLTALLLTACTSHPSEKPSIAEMVGTYGMDAKSVAMLTNEKGYSTTHVSPSIQLFADGSIAIKDLPDCYTDGFGQGHGKYLQGSGKWEVEKSDFGYGITVTVSPGGSLASGFYHASSIIIVGKKPPYSLRFSIGDPDQDEFIAYARKGS